VNAADYKLSQLQSQISANQAAVARTSTSGEGLASRDPGHRRLHQSGTSNTATQLFTSNVNTSGIRSEYSASPPAT